MLKNRRLLAKTVGVLWYEYLRRSMRQAGKAHRYHLLPLLLQPNRRTYQQGLLLRSPVYRSGLAVVPGLLLANLFLGVYYIASVWFKPTDRTYFGT